MMMMMGGGVWVGAKGDDGTNSKGYDFFRV